MNAHQRTLIRLSLAELLRRDETLLSLLNGRVFPNRWDAWSLQELPAMGVYVKSERQGRQTGARDFRELTVTLEIITKADSQLDDFLDAAALAVEKAVSLEALAKTMREKGGEPTVTGWNYEGAELAMSEEGSPLLALLVLTLTLEYFMPVQVPNLPDFTLAGTRWHFAGEGSGVHLDAVRAQDITPLRSNTPAPPGENGEPWGKDRS